MNASEIARTLGGHRSGAQYLCHCLVPNHGKGRGDKAPSLSIADGNQGKLLVRYFAGCDPRDVLAELKRSGLLAEGRQTSPRSNDSNARPLPPRNSEPERALSLWRSAVPAQGTLVETYLRARAITLDIPATLRFIPHLDYLPRIGFPAMVAAVKGRTGAS